MTKNIINVKILKNLKLYLTTRVYASSRRQRMKKLIALILSLALSATLFATLASCGKDKNSDTTVKYEWNTTEDSEGVVTLTSYSVSDAAKDLIADKKYAELADGFTKNAPDGKKYDKDTVKTVTIPANVNKIAAGAIDSLSFIEELIIGENVTEIELGAFSNLSSLKKITLPFTGNKLGAAGEKKLFGYVFGTASSSSLTSCTQTYNDGDSGNTATYYVPTTLEEVVVTGTIKETSETYKVVLDEDGKYIIDEENGTELTFVSEKDSAVQPYAFYGITTIKNVTVKGNLIFANTFNGCTALQKVVIDGENVEVRKSAFNGCTSLKNVTINADEAFKGIVTIDESAFSGCTALGVSDSFSLGKLALPDATKIEASAFGGCSGIVTLALKDGLNVEEALAEKAFNGCTSLIKVFVGSTVIIDTADNQILEDSTLGKIFSSCNGKLYKEVE